VLKLNSGRLGGSGWLEGEAPSRRLRSILQKVHAEACGPATRNPAQLENGPCSLIWSLSEPDDCRPAPSLLTLQNTSIPIGYDGIMTL
jgi:hypothetical protein